MLLFAGLSVGLLILVALFVAAKTFALWLRTRELPELLLSGMLISSSGLGYPLVIASTQVPANEMWWLHVGAQAIMNVGYACLLLFTLKVFRAQTLWAKCLVGLLLVVLVAVCVATGIQSSRDDARPMAQLVGLSLMSSAPIMTTYFWTAFESLAYYRRLKLRLRLGLGEVIVANRVLLWGLMCLAAGSAVLLNNASLLMGSFMSPPIVLASSMLGLVHACCLFVAFHPPAWYKSWLEQGATTGTQAAA